MRMPPRQRCRLALLHGSVFCAAVAGLSISAQAQTFSYSDDFNDWSSMVQLGSGVYPTHAAIPIGWRVAVDPNYYNENELIPQVMNTDGLSDVNGSPALDCWGLGTCYQTQWSSARTDGLGQVDYTVPWSGTPGNANATGRFTLQHQNWENWGRAAAAWYTGVDNLPGPGSAKHTGTYPIDLKNNSLKAEFDLSIRTGSSYWCGYRADGSNVAADGGMFAVQPVGGVNNIMMYGTAGGTLAWAGVPGFGIEFDIYTNSGDPAGDDSFNHTGLDVYLKFDTEAGLLGSLQDNLQGPTHASIPGLLAVGDNNQPIHMTVYYNDSTETPDGSLGYVRVYMYVDPATKAAGDPPVPTGQAAFSYGMDGSVPKNGGRGELVLEGCVGKWPAAAGVFGFLASTGGCNELFAVDNVRVTANTVSGTPCTPDWALPFNAGDAQHPDPISLTGPVAPNAAGLSEPGWEVTSYAALWDTFLEPGATSLVPDVPTALDQFKRSIGYAEGHGLALAHITGAPDINYLDTYNSTDEIMPFGRAIPGFPDSTDSDYFGIVAKGYIYFPQAGDYSLDVASDNTFELRIGGQVVMMDRYGKWGYDPAPGGVGNQNQLNAGVFASVHVAAPGVYPIQLIFLEEWGGADVEFYRRTGDPLEPFLAIGAPSIAVNGTYADQPVIYGQLNGSHAALDLGDIDPSTPPAPVVAVSPTQRVGDAGVVTGSDQVFDFKIVRIQLPGGYGLGNAYEDDYRQNALGYLDNWDNQAPGATVAGINFQGNWWYWHGALPFDGNDPWLAHYFADFGIPDRGDGYDVGNFAFRAEGFAVFPTAGTYILGLEADDDAYLRIGNQTVIQQPCCISQLVALVVPEAGTYPIRVEYAGYGPENRVKFYEEAPGVGKVAVNSSLSRVKVYNTSATGPYVYTYNHATMIPADRKVADNGQGGILGWNATAVKAPSGMVFDGAYQFGYGYGGPMGVATGLIENDINGAFAAGSLAQGHATPLSVNVATGGEFTAGAAAPQNVADDPLTMFTLPDTTQLFATGGDAEDNFALSFTGYIEFPVAGDYVFNTNTDDGEIVWIAGQVATRYTEFSGPGENTPGFVRVDQPGLYDIRVDYYEGGGGNMVELVQYLPDAKTRVLLNDPNSNPEPKRVKVYRTLAGTPLTTEYHDPVRLPLSAKAADINRGGTPGARFQTVKAAYGVGWHYPSNENWGGGGIGTGADKLRTMPEAHELLAAAFDGVPSLGQIPGSTTDQVVAAVDFPLGTLNPPVDVPYTATRTTGYLALTKGGHVFDVASDDGFTFTMAGRVIGQGGDQHGAYPVPFYVYAPEDGLYAFTLEHLGSGGGAPPTNAEGNEIHFAELIYSGTGLPARVIVNTGNASRMYVNLTPCGLPRPDTNLDGSVDQKDFGDFQACFTGSLLPAQPLSDLCACFDRQGIGESGHGTVDSADLIEFENCMTGPGIPWTTVQASLPDCKP